MIVTLYTNLFRIKSIAAEFVHIFLRDFMINIKPIATDTIPEIKMITLFVLEIFFGFCIYPFTTSFRIKALKQYMPIKISTVPKPAR